jgi:hypothetical protein
MDCTLHIGTEKTGTKSIQTFLDLNRALLKQEARVLYTQSLGKEDNRGISFLGYNPDQKDDYNLNLQITSPEAVKAHQQILFSQIAQEINQHRSEVNRVLFSSEHLQSRLWTDEQLIRLKTTLERLELNIQQIVLYIRNPVDLAISLYSTMVKGGMKNATVYPHDNPYINILCNHRETVLRWGAIFGADKLTVRLYKKDTFYKEDLICDFIHTAKLPENLNYQLPKAENISLDITGLEILQRVNNMIPNYVNEKPNPIRGNISAFFIKNCSFAQKLRPSAQMIEAYDLAYKDSNEWVRSHYFPAQDSLFDPSSPANSSPEIDLDEISNLIRDIWTAKIKYQST